MSGIYINQTYLAFLLKGLHGVNIPGLKTKSIMQWLDGVFISFSSLFALENSNSAHLPMTFHKVYFFPSFFFLLASGSQHVILQCFCSRFASAVVLVPKSVCHMKNVLQQRGLIVFLVQMFLYGRKPISHWIRLAITTRTPTYNCVFCLISWQTPAHTLYCSKANQTTIST